jgi:hypothetical protein
VIVVCVCLCCMDGDKVQFFDKNNSPKFSFVTGRDRSSWSPMQGQCNSKAPGPHPIGPHSQSSSSYRSSPQARDAVPGNTNQVQGNGQHS